MPLSAAILRTEGGSGIADGGGRWSRRRFRRFGSLGDGGAALAGAAPAPSVIWPSNAPTATVSPAFTATSDKTPAAGAGTSSVTLSVSSSTSGSSTATASPGCLNHLPTVASVTDSPRVGTRMSAMVQPFQITMTRQPNASSSNCLSCAKCFGICPTAVEAEAGRPA